MFDDKIKYIGCIGVKMSMKSLSEEMRPEVVKESIYRLCNLGRTSKRQNNFDCMLDEEPNLSHSGKKVQLRVTSTHLNVISEDTNQIIIQHEMPNVSFASSGDGDFVAYVAKDSTFGRKCFVFECGHDMGKIILETIAHGFKLRTHQILYNSNTLTRKNAYITHYRYNSGVSSAFHSTDHQDKPDRINNENKCNDSVIAATRAALEKEPWFHGSYLSREESETRLKQEGDFLVRESMLDPGHFVLSVIAEGRKLHLLFDLMGNKVKTKEMEFDDISSLIRYHHDQKAPIVAENRPVHLRNGVRPTPRVKHQP